MKEKYTVLPVSEYLDKTTAGFLGQLVGFFSGYELYLQATAKPVLQCPMNGLKCATVRMPTQIPIKSIRTNCCLMKRADCGRRGTTTITV